MTNGQKQKKIQIRSNIRDEENSTQFEDYINVSKSESQYRPIILGKIDQLKRTW